MMKTVIGFSLVIPLLSASVVQAQTASVTEVEIRPTEEGVELMLTRDSSQPLRQFQTRFGNTLAIDIPNTRLREGESIMQQNPAPNISKVQVLQKFSNSIRILIVGEAKIPTAEIISKDNGILVSIPKASPALAEQTPMNDDEMEKQEIELIVTNLPNDRFSSPIPQVSISREEFTTLPDRDAAAIFERLPGVLVEGPPSGKDQDIRLRGLGQGFTRTEVDGIQLPGRGEAREFNTSGLPSFIIQEGRIIRNPTAEFESDGIAGRVQIETRPIPDDPTFNLAGNFGGLDNFNGDTLNTAIGYGDRVSKTFGFNGYFDFKERPSDVLQQDTEFKNDGTLKKEKVEEKDIDQDLISSAVDLGLFYNRGEVHVKPLFLGLEESVNAIKLETEPGKDPKREESIDDKTRETIGGTIEHTHRFNSGLNWETSLSYFATSEYLNVDKFKFKAGVIDKKEITTEDKEDETFIFKTKATFPFNLGIRQELKIGGMIRLRDRFREQTKVEETIKNEQVTAIKDKTTGEDNYTISEDYFAIFIQDQIFLSERFSVLPGLRLESVSLESADGTGRKGENNLTDLNPSLHLLYRPQDNLSFKAAVSRGVNRPKFEEIAPSQKEKGDRITEGSPNLEPARSWNYDVGVDYKTPSLFLGVNFFYKQVQDIIEESDTGTDIGSKDLVQFLNVGDGYIQGLELEQRLNIGKLLGEKVLEGLVIKANETFIGSELEDQDGNLRPFANQPKFVGNLIAEYTHPTSGISLALAYNYVGERKNFKADDVVSTTAGISTLDFIIRQQINPDLSIAFSVENITDAKPNEEELASDGTVLKRKENDLGQTFLVQFDWKF